MYILFTEGIHAQAGHARDSNCISMAVNFINNE